jgi:chemotaxis protein CheD
VKIVVGIADMRFSTSSGDELVTYALGSCLGISIFDPVSSVGGLLHVMLPDSGIDMARAEENPSVFVDTGVPRLFKRCYAAGAVKERLQVVVVGGAYTGSGEADHFQIGQRNVTMLRRLLWKNGVLIRRQDVGGREARTMSLSMQSGQVRLKRGTSVQIL